MNDERLYFRQLLAGRDFAAADPVAAQMVNFVYLVGDRKTGECVAIDPAWDVRGLLDAAAADGMRLVGALATHYHPDHVGGDLLGFAQVEGLPELLAAADVPVHCQRAEVEWITKTVDVPASALVPHASGDRVKVGEVEIELLHTPGHTPGSQCFRVAGRLLSGDTLFLQACGRTDLPGGDKEEIWRSLHQRLAHLGDDVVLYPGHLYGPAGSATLGDTRATNQVFRVRSLDDWLRLG